MGVHRALAAGLCRSIGARGPGSPIGAGMGEEIQSAGTQDARSERQRVPFALAIVSTLLLLLAAVAAIGTTTGGVHATSERQLRVQELCGEIERLDEVLTMAASMAAASGEPKWRRQYDVSLAPLDAAIAELRAMSPTVFDRELGADTDAANQRLIAQELAAFAAIERGQRDQAKEILEGPNYAADKNAYAVGTARAREVMRDIAAYEYVVAERFGLSLLLGTLALAVVAGVAWLRVLSSSLAAHARAQMASARAEIELATASSRAKSEFVANISHELRTPLTAILGHAELLGDDTFPAEARADAIATVLRNGQHLLQVINDLLDMSKIEAGAVTFRPEPVDVAALVEDVLSLLRVRARSKGLQLERTFATPIPRRIATDPCRLRQILVNLIGNAIKFTAAGAVHVEVRCGTPVAGTPWLSIAVRDTGIGMTPGEVARLFRAFQQADASTERRFGGTGLGLAIARHYARLLGGDIVVRSEPGNGSVFTVTIAGEVDAAAGTWLPEGGDRERTPSAPMPDATVEGDDVTEGLRGARILLAEDGADNQRLLTFLLRRVGATVEAVDNGRIACERMNAADGAFDLVLMDMHMPERDGYEATRQARASGYSRPIVALTANAMSSDRARCLQAGCDDYLTKPVDRRALLATCARWARASRGVTASS